MKALAKPRWAESRLLNDQPKFPKRAQKRTYASAKGSRLTAGWYSANNSSDSELVSSLTMLRARSRQLCRDAPYAKRAKVVVVNNVIGSGIGMEPKVTTPRGKLIEAINDAIEASWDEWSRPGNCHTGGKLHFNDIERQCLEQIFEAGEVLIRKHYQPFGPMGVPFTLELVEAERLADEFTKPPVMGDVGLYRMGIEHDEFGRALGFWLRRYHPGEVRFPQGIEPNIFFRVPAQEMYHLYSCSRWPQSRGEPWLHAVARRLNDMDGYSEAEITAARGAAAYMATIESPEDPQWSDTDENSQAQFELEPGLIQELDPGQKLNFVAPNRPNPNMDPFMRMMLREVAAGVGVSYESLSRDYSQSNYSSSRLALLDDRDLWKVLQQWFIRSFREPLHREWLQQAVLAGKVAGISAQDYLLNPARYNAVSFKPRGWSWVDPVKEVQAFKDARRAGFMSTSQIIALTGGGCDIEDVWDEIQGENDDAKARGLVVTTDPAQILEGRETDATQAGADPVAPLADPNASSGERAIGDLRRDFADLRTELRFNAKVATLPQPVNVTVKSEPSEIRIQNDPMQIKFEGTLKQEPLTVRTEATVHNEPVVVQMDPIKIEPIKVEPQPVSVTVNIPKTESTRVVTLNPRAPDGSLSGTVTETIEATG